MKRVILVIFALAVIAGAPATAKASAPCRDRIYNDWYADGKIATTYPVACYRDALKHVKGDALIYSSLSDDIRAAMQGALAKAKGDTKVPAQIGNTGPAAKNHSKHRSTSSGGPPHDPAPGHEQQVDTTLPTPSTVAAGTTSGSSSGVPVPLLVLGGLALLLTAVGGVGVVAKRRRL